MINEKCLDRASDAHGLLTSVALTALSVLQKADRVFHENNVTLIIYGHVINAVWSEVH